MWLWRDSVLVALAGVLCCCVILASAQERRTGNTCSIDMDCPDNAFCRSSTYCVCKDGFIITPYNASHRECIKEAQYGEECREHIQCRSKLGVHAECAVGVCACKSTAHFEAGRCYETAVVGERCSVMENCYLGEGTESEKQAFCVRGFCQCQWLYSPRDEGTRCLKDANLGETCEDQLQCAGVGQQCRQGACHCVEGWVAAHNTDNVCLESAKNLGASCEYDVQCDSLAGSSGAAVCLNEACTCKWGTRSAGVPERCWHKRRPGEDCKFNEECVSEEDEQGYCHRGRCTCATCVPDARDFNSAITPVARAMLLLPAAILSIAMGILLQ